MMRGSSKKHATGGPSYEKARDLADRGRAAERHKLADHGETAPEILFYLAEDDDRKVRRAVAKNRRTPVQASLILCRDRDAEVREELARKVSRLSPDFDPQSQSKLTRAVVETLEVLARDSASKVRLVLADSLKDLTNAPPKVIRTLADDIEDEIACLVLQASPLLTDEELLSIIDQARSGCRLTAVSRRVGLGEKLSDAIVESDEGEAIAALLNNGSAQIRETTLDRLVEKVAKAPDRGTALEEPLVRRPELSCMAIGRLAAFVSEALLPRLERHPALDADSAKLLAEQVRARLERDQHPTSEPRPEAAEAQELLDKGQLDSEAMSDALAAGRKIFVVEGLALKSGEDRELVLHIIESASAKGAMAIAWKAGLSMHFAAQLQFRLCGLTMKEAIVARPDGNWPLSEDEMEWQLGFFRTMLKDSQKRDAG